VGGTERESEIHFFKGNLKKKGGVPKFVKNKGQSAKADESFCLHKKSRRRATSMRVAERKVCKGAGGGGREYLRTIACPSFTGGGDRKIAFNPRGEPSFCGQYGAGIRRGREWLRTLQGDGRKGVMLGNFGLRSFVWKGVPDYQCTRFGEALKSKVIARGDTGKRWEAKISMASQGGTAKKKKMCLEKRIQRTIP